MQNTSLLQESLQKARQAPLVRPGMYFGKNGPDAIPVMAYYLLAQPLTAAPNKYEGPISISVSQSGKNCSVTIEFPGFKSRVWSARKLGEILGPIEHTRNFDRHFAMIVAMASKRFHIDSCDGKTRLILEIHDGYRVSVRQRTQVGTPHLRFTFEPVSSVFQRPTSVQLYAIGGMLRDFSLLRAGLATCLRADGLDADLSYFYADGMKSYLFEDDQTRWPLHPDCLSFKASTKEMRVEGHLRFLHAGVGEVRNYVNFRRTHGGTHMEGLGDALRDVFPDASLGCREVVFITNPDTRAKVLLPHAFHGVMHVQMLDPHFAGPTKDILCSKNVRAFVREAASATLKQQWEAQKKY